MRGARTVGAVPVLEKGTLEQPLERLCGAWSAPLEVIVDKSQFSRLSRAIHPPAPVYLQVGASLIRKTAPSDEHPTHPVPLKSSNSTTEILPSCPTTLRRPEHDAEARQYFSLLFLANRLLAPCGAVEEKHEPHAHQKCMSLYQVFFGEGQVPPSIEDGCIISVRGHCTHELLSNYPLTYYYRASYLCVDCSACSGVLRLHVSMLGMNKCHHNGAEMSLIVPEPRKANELSGCAQSYVMSRVMGRLLTIILKSQHGIGRVSRDKRD